MVAPTRSSSRQAKTTATIRQSFGKVSKPTSQLKSKKGVDLPEDNTVRIVVATPEKKRKREEDEPCNLEHLETTKKSRKFLGPIVASPNGLTRCNARPDTSSSESRPDQRSDEENPLQVPDLPESLALLISLHNAFVKALSIHFAHNGMSAPAMLTTLLESITRLWKRRQVQKQDIRKMLALQELRAGRQWTGIADGVVEHGMGQFMLLQSGLGIQHLLVEYVGHSRSATSFNEQILRSEYLNHVNNLWIYSQNDESTCRMLQQYDNIPQLSIKLGAQQAARNQKAQLLRKSILTPTSQTVAPVSSDLSISQTQSNTSQSAPSRSQSLLDRILNKQRLAVAAGPKPTAEQVAVHRAKSRLPELADVLLILQKQRTRNQAISRISFQYLQLAQYIKDSARVPIGEEEIRMGLKVLAEQVAEDWVQFCGGVARSVEGKAGEKSMDFVVLTGRGLSGVEVRERLERM